MKLQKSSFLFGAIFVAAIVALIGARAPSEDASKTYDAHIGLGGFQVLDHSTNTFYLYYPSGIVNPNGDSNSMKLLMSVDLNKAGDKELKTTEFESDK
jgi:hypothetical protein